MGASEKWFKRGVGTVAIVAVAWLAACGDRPSSEAPDQEIAAGEASAVEAPVPPEIQTPIGPFTFTRVEIADQYPSWCTPGAPPAYAGAPQCIAAEGGDRFLIIHIQNPDADGNADLIRSIESDYEALTVFSDDGTEWESAYKEWRIFEGLFLVRYGPGTPQSVTLHWPGNDPITLTPSGS